MPDKSRDALARLVRTAWIKWARQQPNPKASWLVEYDQLSEADKEADRQIGEAVAASAIASATAAAEAKYAALAASALRDLTELQQRAEALRALLREAAEHIDGVTGARQRPLSDSGIMWAKIMAEISPKGK